MWAYPINDQYTNKVDSQNKVECVLAATEIAIYYQENGLRAKKVYNVFVEKMEFKELIQLRLTEKCDQRRMYISIVDNASFLALKQDQSLHVTFSGFVENLLRMLQDCNNGKLELSLIAHQNENCNSVRENPNYQLQFVEMRTFKNLVHLCLPCRVAPLNTVLFYVSILLDEANKKARLQEQLSQQLKDDVRDEQQRFEKLNEEHNKLLQKFVENSRNISNQHAQERQQIQNKIHELSEQYANDKELSQTTISELQKQLAKISQEKKNMFIEKEQDLKRIEKLNEELIDFNSRVSTLKSQNEKLHSDITTMKSKEHKQNSNMEEARRQITELQEKLKQCIKEKANIAAEFEAERKILSTKRQALEMATEEIAKANQIILNQNQELVKHKKTIELRTEVAIQQEKALKEIELLVGIRDKEIIRLRKTTESLQKEIPTQINSMRQFAQSLELKYMNEIKCLKEKLDLIGNQTATNIAPQRNLKKF